MIDVSTLPDEHPLPENLVPGDLGVRTKKDTGQRPWYDLLLREVLKGTPWVYSHVAYYRAWVSGEAYENKQFDGQATLVLMLDPTDVSEEAEVIIDGSGFVRRPRRALGWTNPCRFSIPEGPARIYWSLSF